MTLTSPSPDHNRRLSAFALTVAVHLVLLWGWRLSTRPDAAETAGVVNRIQWLLVPKTEPAQDSKASPPPLPSPARKQTPEKLARPLPEGLALEPGESDDAEPAEAPPPKGLLERAKLAVGAIDRELQNESNHGRIRAKPVTAQMRLARGMQLAHDIAPNKWYEAPKVTEIIDPGGYGRRRYRVVGARGEYCVTYESNHAPDGIDSIQHGIKPKLTTCDPDEQKATKQDW